MATVILCDHDNEAALYRITVQFLDDQPQVVFDCCSAACAASCFSEHLTSNNPGV